MQVQRVQNNNYNQPVFNGYISKKPNINFLKKHGIKIPELVELVYNLKNKGINLEINNWDKKVILEEIVNKVK